MSKTLLDKVYINIKNKIKTIFKKSFLFNVISNESNNIKDKQILNMTILIKNHYVFYIFLKFTKDKCLDTAQNAY